jgi:hypothetical protein
VETTEANEDVAERQEMVLETTDEVITKDTPIGGSDSGGTMADETLGVTVSDEAILVMVGEAIHEAISITAEEAPDVTHVSAVDVADIDKAFEIIPVMEDETFAGMVDETRVDAAYEVISVVADFNIAIVVGSVAEDDHDQDVDSVDSEETTSDEPQPLQIIPFADQRDEPHTIDPVGFRSNPHFARMASIMEGISLFGVAPRFERVLRKESSPMVVSDYPPSGVCIDSQVPALEGTSIQDVDDGGMADTEVCGVDAIPAGDISLVDESKFFAFTYHIFIYFFAGAFSFFFFFFKTPSLFW